MTHFSDALAEAEATSDAPSEALAQAEATSDALAEAFEEAISV